MKVHYTYDYYPYSKRATRLSRQSKLSWMIAMIVLMCSVPMLIAKVLWDQEMFIHPLIPVVLSFGYIVYYAAVIPGKIDKIAREDYIAELTKQIAIEREKIKNLPRE